MLHTVDDDDLVGLDDLVDDPVIASAGGAEAFELAEEGLAEPLRVGGDRSQDRFEGGGSHPLGQSMEMAETFGGDLDFVQVPASDVVPQPQPLAFGCLEA